MKKYIFAKILAVFFFLTIAFSGANFVFALDPSTACGPCCDNGNCKASDSLQCVGALPPCDSATLKVTGAGKLGQCLSNDLQITTFCPFSSHTDITKLANEITKWIFILALVIAPLMILFGGFYMLTAAGDPSRAGKGRAIITWAMVGLAVIVFAKAFISIIKFVLK